MNELINGAYVTFICISLYRLNWLGEPPKDGQVNQMTLPHPHVDTGFEIRTQAF